MFQGCASFRCAKDGKAKVAPEQLCKFWKWTRSSREKLDSFIVKGHYQENEPGRHARTHARTHAYERTQTHSLPETSEDQHVYINQNLPKYGQCLTCRRCGPDHPTRRTPGPPASWSAAPPPSPPPAPHRSLAPQPALPAAGPWSVEGAGVAARRDESQSPIQFLKQRHP